MGGYFIVNEVKGELRLFVPFFIVVIIVEYGDEFVIDGTYTLDRVDRDFPEGEWAEPDSDEHGGVVLANRFYFVFGFVLEEYLVHRFRNALSIIMVTDGY